MGERSFKHYWSRYTKKTASSPAAVTFCRWKGKQGAWGLMVRWPLCECNMLTTPRGHRDKTVHVFTTCVTAKLLRGAWVKTHIINFLLSVVCCQFQVMASKYLNNFLWLNLFTNLVIVDWIVCGLFGACLLPLSSYCDSHHGVNIGAWQMPSFKDMDSNLKKAKGSYVSFTVWRQ